MRRALSIARCGAAVAAAVFLFSTFAVSGAGDLPVIDPTGTLPTRDHDVRNPYTFRDIHGSITDGDEQGLFFSGDPYLRGRIFTGPYPFEAGEADYDYFRFRASGRLAEGRGKLRLDIFLRDTYNANAWPEGQGLPYPTMTAGYRIDLSSTDPDPVKGGHHGFYDGVVSFRLEDGVFRKNLTIVEGPFVTMLTSDDPSSVVIVVETDRPSACRLKLSSPYPPSDNVPEEGFAIAREISEDDLGTRHEMRAGGLLPGMKYYYMVECRTSEEEAHSSVYSFRTPPPAGQGSVSFAFISDSRQGVGGGERAYMGLNRHSLSRLVTHAYRHGADLLVFGGDLVNGYTTRVEDFRMQLRGWKQAVAGFWRSRPVYPAMGNHESLLNVFDDGSYHGLSLDKWPYETSSAEAVFADEFFNPANGPIPSDPRRPTYEENVYRFQYGPVLFIAFNNNYWWTTNDECKNYGGAPEGYMMADQVEWIEKALEVGESDPEVLYIVLYAQEPVFPCGGHPDDAMWWMGDNNVRAYEYDGGSVIPAGPGIIDVRNRFWEAVARSTKVAAVLAGDEHAYHRILIDGSTPVGVPDKDDLDGNGKLDDGRFSPHPGFRHPTWHLTAGTGGAPYYAQEPGSVPWAPEFFSSQTGYCLLEADSTGISMTFYTITGQELDRVENLMAVK
jgi:hypothetical protein